MKKKIISILILLSLFLSALSQHVKGEARQDSCDEMLLYRILEITEMNKTSICNIEYLEDFADNKYTIVEFDPYGYAIAHNESKVIVEYNLHSRSPFENCTGEHFYGGPSCYYEKTEDGYRHTVLKESLGPEDLQNLHKKCENDNRELLHHKIKLLQDSAQDYSGIKSMTYTDYWVYSPSFFYTKYNGFGYISGNYCGFIAANFLLKYHHYQGHISLPSNYLPMNSTTLTNTLKSIGNNAIPTYAWTLKNTINTFCGNNLLPQYAGWDPLLSGVPYEIGTKHRPVILYGSFPGASAHAIVAYGYNSYENPGYTTYIVHYGWEGTVSSNYAQVHICALNSSWESNVSYTVE